MRLTLSDMYFHWKGVRQICRGRFRLYKWGRGLGQLFVKKRAVALHLVQELIFIKHQILSGEFGPFNPVDLIDYVAEFTELERVSLFGGQA